MSNYIKQEPSESSSDVFMKKNRSRQTISLISISSSSSDSDEDEFGTQLNPNKKQRVEAVLPAWFLDPIRPEKPTAVAPPITAGNAMVPVREEINNVSAAAAEKGKRAVVTTNTAAVVRNCKQFWRAGDYEGISNGGDVSLDRLHPFIYHVRKIPNKRSFNGMGS
ncbi:hypothetical protein ABFS82_12G050400 [Erythranthe guttata]